MSSGHCKTCPSTRLFGLGLCFECWAATQRAPPQEKPAQPKPERIQPADRPTRVQRVEPRCACTRRLYLEGKCRRCYARAERQRAPFVPPPIQWTRVQLKDPDAEQKVATMSVGVQDAVFRALQLAEYIVQEDLAQDHAYNLRKTMDTRSRRYKAARAAEGERRRKVQNRIAQLKDLARCAGMREPTRELRDSYKYWFEHAWKTILQKLRAEVAAEGKGLSEWVQRVGMAEAARLKAKANGEPPVHVDRSKAPVP